LYNSTMKDFKSKLKEIANLREVKGKEKETLEEINSLLPIAEQAEEWKTTATLYWEAHLVWQHTVMAEESKADSDEEAMKQGIQKMMEYAEKAKDVIEKHDIEDMAGGAYRFLGRAATYAGDHEKAKEYYETALSKYSGKNLRSTLEVNGFISEALVKMGNFQEGLKLAKDTYDSFFNSKLGNEIKEKDYFTWAVWMSGIPPRICTALVEGGYDFDKEEMRAWLGEAKTHIENPSGEVTWGDHNFQFRIDEFNTALGKL